MIVAQMFTIFKVFSQQFKYLIFNNISISVSSFKSRVTPSWAGPWECCQTSLTTILSYYEGRYNMFKILRPKRTYYFDNIVTPSAYICLEYNGAFKRPILYVR